MGTSPEVRARRALWLGIVALAGLLGAFFWGQPPSRGSRDQRDAGLVPEHAPGAVLPASAAEQSRRIVAGNPHAETRATRPNRILGPGPFAIRGIVVTDRNRPVPHVRIVCDPVDPGFPRIETVRGAADHEGSFAITGLHAWEYRVFVDPASYDDSLTPPPADARRPPPDPGLPAGHPAHVPRSRYGVFVRAGPESASALRLVLFEATGLVGRVITPDGVGLRSWWVRLADRRIQLAGHQSDTETDAEGRFELRRLAPGPYRLTCGPLVESGALSLASPLPLSLELASPHAREVVLIAGAGNASLRGRVRDQDGNPVADLDVVCYRREAAEPGFSDAGWNAILFATTTDAAGRYTLPKLPAGPLRIQAGTRAYRPGAGIGASRLACWPAPLDCEVPGTGGTHDVADLEVWPSRPCLVSGTVRVATNWERRERLRAPALTMRVSPEPGTSMRGVPMRDQDLLLHWAASADGVEGTFEFRCETPHVPVVFALRTAVSDAEPRVLETRALAPVRGRTLEIRFDLR